MNSNVIPFPTVKHSTVRPTSRQFQTDIADQLVRLFALIDEVEQLSEMPSNSRLSGGSCDLPALVRKLRTPLRVLASSPINGAPDSETDPQPEIDNSLLEQLYGIPPA